MWPSCPPSDHPGSILRLCCVQIGQAMVQHAKFHHLAAAAQSSQEESPGIGIPGRHYSRILSMYSRQRSYWLVHHILLDPDVPGLLSSSEQTVTAHFVCIRALRMVWPALRTRSSMVNRPIPHGKIGDECRIVVVTSITKVPKAWPGRILKNVAIVAELRVWSSKRRVSTPNKRSQGWKGKSWSTVCPGGIVP